MDRDQWLAQVREDIAEPDLAICDPHHHLWDHPGRRYLLDELLADTARSGKRSRTYRSLVIVSRCSRCSNDAEA